MVTTMARIITVEVEAPKDLVQGEVFEVEVEVPTQPRQRRGQLAGLTLEEMTDEQLKREITNANSVLYKAKQRGAAESTIAANEARVEAAKAEKAKRAGEEEVEEVAEDSVYVDEDTAEEI